MPEMQAQFGNTEKKEKKKSDRMLKQIKCGKLGCIRTS